MEEFVVRKARLEDIEVAASIFEENSIKRGGDWSVKITVQVKVI